MARPRRDDSYIQEMPPEGGFPPINIERNLRKRGPHGLIMFLGVGVTVVTGMYLLIQSNHERRQAKVEKRIARINLMPLLQAEADEVYVADRRQSAIRDLQRRKEIQKNENFDWATYRDEESNGI